MRVEQIMNAPAICCHIDDRLDVPAQMMWESDCGVIPVISNDGTLCGMITDRDICMATHLRGQPPRDIGVAEVMAKDIVSCVPQDTLEAVERQMSERQVRRAPVVDAANRVVGVLSLNDIARAAASTKKDGLDRGLVQTMAAICEPNGSTSARPAKDFSALR